MATPFSPPRLTGVQETDLVLIANWMNDFYRAVVLEDEYVTVASEFDTGAFDPSNLPDPASATIAKAQQTANEAYALAAAAKTLADTHAARLVESGTITVSETDTTAEFTFAEPEPDSSYFVSATLQATSGTPDAGSTDIDGIAKATDKFTLDVGTAPGAGNSVTFDVNVLRNT